MSVGATCGKTLSWEYDTAGLLTAQVYPSGARVEWGYPPAGQPLHERPVTLTLVIGPTRTPLVTDIVWAQGEAVAYATPAGDWHLTRRLDGTPQTIGGPRPQSFNSFDGWGNPGTIGETVWQRTLDTSFVHNDLPALTEADAGQLYPPQGYTYLVSGDRKTANGAPYCYEAGTHRLALVGGLSRFTYTAEGAMAPQQCEQPQGVQFGPEMYR